MFIDTTCFKCFELCILVSKTHKELSKGISLDKFVGLFFLAKEAVFLVLCVLRSFFKVLPFE